jgi:hypothetical protein
MAPRVGTISQGLLGRPAFVITPEVIQKAKDLATLGMPKGFIAKALGISHDTLNRKEKQSEAFAEAIEQGRAACLEKVMQGMVINATTPTKEQPGGMWAAQAGLYDRIVGRADTEVKMLVVPLFNEPTPRALLEHSDEE